MTTINHAICISTIAMFVAGASITTSIVAAARVANRPHASAGLGVASAGSKTAREVRSIQLESARNLLSETEWSLIDDMILARARAGFGYFNSKIQTTGDLEKDRMRNRAIADYYESLGFSAHISTRDEVEVVIRWE